MTIKISMGARPLAQVPEKNSPIESGWGMRTGSTEFLDALSEAGVSYLFSNLGSDHPGLVEALARASATGLSIPQLITCPTEFVALCAAHGFAQVSGVAQAVIVHVECGTQSLAGAVHNAAKGRIPVLIYAGASPFTQAGEMRGSRNEFIQWIQDVFDQRGLVRGYMKYDNEFRTSKNIKQVVNRALRFAYSDPKGPVYLVGAREVMEEKVDAPVARQIALTPVSPSAISRDSVKHIAEDLLSAHRPLIVTSYLGRNTKAVGALVSLAESLGIGVLESVPNYMNFPHSNELYLGNQWNEAHQNPILENADAVLVIDSDVPWIPLMNCPNDRAVIHHIDVDPLKVQMPLSVISACHSYQADAEIALNEINAYIATAKIPADIVAERRRHYSSLHRQRRIALSAKERATDSVITPEYLTACIRERLDDTSLVVSEGISNYQTIMNHLRMSIPGSIFTSGGGSLGWNGGAAIGVKLASPDKTVFALTGDGSFMMSIPSSVHWMARRYKAPFLQIIYNNGGWKSPMLSTLAIHPDGYASKADDIGVKFSEAPDYAALAVSAGAGFGRVVKHPNELAEALDMALHTVCKLGRAAVLDVRLPEF